MEYVKIHRHLCSKEQILIFKSIKMLEIRCIQVIWRWNLVAEGWRERSMATNGLDPVERPKHGRLQSRQSWHIFWNAPVYREKGIKESPSSFQSFQALLQTEGIIKTLWTFRTTFCYHCKIQWFWEQWLGTTVELRVFFDGYGVRQPLVSIVFDGCLPWVRWWKVIFHRWGLFRDH